MAANYSDLKVRYYSTADGNKRLQVEVDERHVWATLYKLAEVTGAEGQPLTMQLTDLQGRVLSVRLSERRQRFSGSN